jgi:hypothetical protein
MQPQQNQTGQDSGSRDKLDKQQKESLVSMIAILYIENQGLLNEEQLIDAKASLRALFLRATGEETMLRKLIEILRTNHALNQGFSDISSVLGGVSKSSETIRRKTDTLKSQLNSPGISAEENIDFVGPFLGFAADFIMNVEQFERLIYRYRDEREREARYAHMFRIAKEARLRLKQRIAGALGDEGDRETEIREKMIQSFDYGDTEIRLKHSRREAQGTLSEIESVLGDFKEMCQLAMNPAMRDPEQGYQPFRESRYEDIFALFVEAQSRYPELEMIRASIQELLRLFQHSYGMFMLDFQKFNHAITPMTENTEAYFQAKDDDEDIRTKREKLGKIEGLIAFLETASVMLRSGEEFGYSQFSTAVSDIITRVVSNWNHISEDLLRMKVVAEADLSTRLS